MDRGYWKSKIDVPKTILHLIIFMNSGRKWRGGVGSPWCLLLVWSAQGESLIVK